MISVIEGMLLCNRIHKAVLQFSLNFNKYNVFITAEVFHVFIRWTAFLKVYLLEMGLFHQK